MTTLSPGTSGNGRQNNLDPTSGDLEARAQEHTTCCKRVITSLKLREAVANRSSSAYIPSMHLPQIQVAGLWGEWS